MSKRKPRKEEPPPMPPEAPPKAPVQKRTGVPLHVYIPPDLRDALHELADENARKVTAEVILALQAHLRAAGKWPRRAFQEPPR